ncbi:50S ribosomal protein L18 [Candidatus Woesearchaeota archaeon]|nr:50S ribosomal protein L18P [uncultured archaeon]MBS3175141.1 50S ribosomal protein L18 [Candidatus Woesearchaeota archaeon]
MKKGYTVKFRRKREGKTDYRSRLKLLASNKSRIVVRRSLRNVMVQFTDLGEKGDKTLVVGHSRELLQYGWKSHKGNIPSAYLVGYLAGLKAKKEGIKDGVLDLGLSKAVKGSSFFSAIKGVIDAGINVNCSKEILPDEDTIKGKKIADYAKSLSNNKDLYSKQFSNYLKIGLKPEDFTKNFEEAKKKIIDKWQHR